MFSVVKWGTAGGEMIKIYLDSARISEIEDCCGHISGVTTNPTLMRNEGITDYAAFGKNLASRFPGFCFSFEVFADDPQGMLEEARIIADWGPNVYVKIPITNTKGVSSLSVIRLALDNGIKVNATAILSLNQLRCLRSITRPTDPLIVSVFAGRIADTARIPLKIMREAVSLFAHTNAEILWASSREVLDKTHAEMCGCHIITLTKTLINKLDLAGKDLDEFSLETVRMFYNDALRSGLKLQFP